MVLQQARLLAFGLRLPPYRCNSSVLGTNPTAAVFTTRRYCTAETFVAPATSAAEHLGSRNISASVNSSTGSSFTRRRRRPWWGMTLSGSTSREVGPARMMPPPGRLLLHHQRGLFLPATRRLMSTHRPDGMGGTREEVVEEEGEEDEEDDGLLSSLAEELVWKGGDEEERDGQEEYEVGELQGLDLESLGISMHDDENAEEVREQLRRERGTVSVSNDQDKYEVDTLVLQEKLSQAMKVLGCQSWDVGVVLTTDKEVTRLNRRYRGITTSTDILSFANNDLSGAPGVLPKVRFPAEMDLGDMFISLAYVDRQIKRDREEEKAAAAATAATATGREEEGEEEWWDSERGVSGAMSRVYDVQERASMLLVHGLIHLLGYDHETQEDYEAMVAVEEEVLEAVFGKYTAGPASPDHAQTSK